MNLSHFSPLWPKICRQTKGDLDLIYVVKMFVERKFTLLCYGYVRARTDTMLTNRNDTQKHTNMFSSCLANTRGDSQCNYNFPFDLYDILCRAGLSGHTNQSVYVLRGMRVNSMNRRRFMGTIRRSYVFVYTPRWPLISSLIPCNTQDSAQGW